MAWSFLDLPTEVLLHVFATLPTSSILPLSAVSHRFYALTCRVLHHRLKVASRLPDHTLLLECYHPSAQLTEPSFDCTYFGTQGLDIGDEICKEDGSGEASFVGRLEQYKNLYSVYRPQRRQPDEQARRIRHPAGDVPGSRTHPTTSQSWIDTNPLDPAVRQRLVLEGHELFTQLIANLNLARLGPRRGLFLSFVDVGEGVIRVWRDWLITAANACEMNHSAASHEEACDPCIDEDQVLWIGSAKNVGLRLKVRRSKWCSNEQAPILMPIGEEVHVAFDIEYHELLVRTSHLVFTLEESLAQQSNQSGKAIVIGSFG